MAIAASQFSHKAVYSHRGKPTCAAYLVVAYLTAAFDQGQNQPEVVPVHQVGLPQKLQVAQDDILHSQIGSIALDGLVHNGGLFPPPPLLRPVSGCHYRAQCSGHERTLSDDPHPQDIIAAIHAKPQWADTGGTPRRHVWACQMVSKQ